MPVLLLGVACRNAATDVPTEPDQSEQAFAGNVILGRPTASSITASLLSERDAEVYLEYGTQAGTYPQRTAAVRLQAGVPANVSLAGLAADTRYHYRIRTGSGTAPATLPVHAFHTQRSLGQEFTFDVEADPHDGDGSFDGQVFATAMARVAADTADFLIDLGDSFMTEKRSPANYDDVLRITAGLRPYWAGAAADVPLLLALGNHDGEQGWELNGSESLAAWAVRARQRLYPNPVPGGTFYSGSTTTEPIIGVRDGYYAFAWGDALFVVLDPYWYTLSNPGRDFWAFSLGDAQYRWLARTLRESSARYKFVFAHQLLTGILDQPRGGTEAAGLYEWGGKNLDGTWGFSARRPGWEKPIHQLLVETGVTAVFHGHDHFFNRQELDGIVYQLLPQPSYARITDQYSPASYGYLSGVMFGSSGYLRIRVSPARALVEYVKVYPAGLTDGRKTGDIAYSYSLSPRR